MKTILVVDDDTTLRIALKRYLESRGYSVQDSESGAKALEIFEQNRPDLRPDLVVSDVMMPEMNGYDFCRRLRATRSGQLVPFIFLSSKGEVEDRVQGHDMGADDYLIKPFEPRELVAKIEAQLERARRTHVEILKLVQQAPPVEMLQPLPFTPSEERIFWEAIKGYTNKQIADRLFLSPRTIQSHISNILNKLQLENRAQLVRFCYERGYKPPEDDKAEMEDDSEAD